MKICLISYSDIYFRTILKRFEKSKIEYCKKNNIDYIYEDVNQFENINFKLSWIKIYILKKYIKKYDVIYITDHDSFIYNSNYNLKKLIYDNHNSDLILSKLNTWLLGCSIWYNTSHTNRIIDILLDVNKNYNYLAEEKYFNNLDLSCLNIKHEDAINYIHNMGQECYKPFVYHLAGIGNPYLMKKIYNEKTQYIQ